jgi:hypothetical protein
MTSYLLIPAAVKRLAIPSVRTSVPHGHASFFAAGAFTGIEFLMNFPLKNLTGK